MCRLGRSTLMEVTGKSARSCGRRAPLGISQATALRVGRQAERSHQPERLSSQKRRGAAAPKLDKVAQVHAPSDATIQTHVADLKRALVNRRKKTAPPEAAAKKS